MSHSAWLVAVPSGWGIEGVQSYLDGMLGRFSEELDVEPYRKVDSESVATWWEAKYYLGLAQKYLDTFGLNDEEFVDHLLTEARGGKDISPYEEDRIIDSAPEMRKHYENVYVAVRSEGRGNVLTANGEVLAALPTVETVDPAVMTAIINAIYAKDVPGDQTERYEYEPADGKIYRWTTYNPESLWDWWQIGGRWSGALLARPDAPTHQLIGAKTHWTETFDLDEPHREEPRRDQLEVNGGLVGALDIASMRANASVEAHEAYDKWVAALDLVKDELISEAHNWGWFLAQKDLGVMTINEARTAYHAQPLYIATKDIMGTSVFGPSPLDTFLGVTRDEYVTKMVDRAAVFFGFIDSDAHINRKGKMGWFGLDSSTDESEAAYVKAANDWLDSLSQDTILVILDFHI